MVKLIDIYSGNEWWNPEKALGDGYSGVIFKGGQGKLSDVPRVKKNWAEDAHKAGLMVGWYWLMDSRYRPSEQVEVLRESLGDSLGELGIWVDCEKPVLSWKDAQYWKTPYAGLHNIVDFMYLLEKRTGIKANVYTSPGFWGTVAQRPKQSDLDYLSGTKLWTAQYPWIYVPGISKPTKYGPWEKWTLWQYKERPDINLYNGTDEEFYSEFNGVYIPPVIEEKPAYTVLYVNAPRGLLLRDAPSGEKIGSIRNRARVEVSDLVSGWYHIESIDESVTSGWASAQYLIV